MSLTQNDKLPHKASIIQYCDTQRNPIAVEQKPRLSWRIADVPDGYMQTAYRIRVASCREKLAEAVGAGGVLGGLPGAGRPPGDGTALYALVGGTGGRDRPPPGWSAQSALSGL